MMPNVPKEKVKKYLDRQREIFKREGPDAYRRNMADYLSVAGPSAAGATIAASQIEDQ